MAMEQNSALLSQDGKTPIISTTSPGLTSTELNGKRLYAVACKAGHGLGPDLQRHNAQFIGYRDPFVFSTYYAHVFGAVVNEGLVFWLEADRSAQEVVEHLRTRWEQVYYDYSREAAPA